jgi:hypothetical protein
MSFSLPRFVRRTPPSTLSLYFSARRIALPDEFDWDGRRRTFPGALHKAIEGLPTIDLERVFEDLERIDLLCDPIGQKALQSLIAHDRALLNRLQSADSDETRGVLVLLENEALFDHALAVSYADRLRNGRSWSAFSIPGPATATGDLERLKEWEVNIAAVLTQFDGTGRKIKIDSFKRTSPGRDGNPTVPTIHHSIYAEGLPESHLEFEREEPKRRTRRPVHEGAISYDPERRVLDVIARGGKSVREKLAQSYAQHVLGLTDGLRPILLRSFNLERLKRPILFPTDSADGVKSINVTLLRLQDMSDRYGRVTIEIDDPGRTDIHAVGDQWFRDADPLKRPDWHVIAAKLKIVFFAETSGRRDKTITIELRAPNGSNLREQIRHHQIISEKYLERWGLIAGGSGG